MLDFLSGFSAHLIYCLLFVLLFLCGLGFPFAEEPVLLAGGVFVASGVLNVWLTFLATFLGVIISDILLFWLGRGLALRLTTSVALVRWLPRRRLVHGEAFFARYGSTAIFLVRFIPGLRAPTFLLAGTMRMGLGRFLLMDTLAACLYVPLVCGLGYAFADRLDAITSWFRNVKRAILTLGALLGLVWLFWYYCGKRIRQAAALLGAEPPDC
jgi:membrane protein DedA with SNARE-associated domain